MDWGRIASAALLQAFYSARDLDQGDEFRGHNISIRRDRAVPDALAATLRRAYYGAVAFCDHNRPPGLPGAVKRQRRFPRPICRVRCFGTGM
jgi:hypothetical protein